MLRVYMNVNFRFELYATSFECTMLLYALRVENSAQRFEKDTNKGWGTIE
jgi:hypothetical protein